MKVLFVVSQFNYGDSQRGEGYEFTNFLPALKNLGHDVVIFESRDKKKFKNYAELNRSLLSIISEYKPDVLLAVLTHYEIWIETWEIIKESGICATINWTTDDSWKFKQFSRFLSPYFHAFTTTYSDTISKYHATGVDSVMLTQWAASSNIMLKPKNGRDCKYNVTFVGSAHGNRKRKIEALKESGVKVICFGYGWKNGAIKSQEIPKIVNDSVISLNFANSPISWRDINNQSSNQIKARTFEVPGAGGFLVTESANNLDKYYEAGKEIITFRGIKDLVEIIKYYNSNLELRDAIAIAGYNRTIRDHTYEMRFREVLNFAVEQKERYERFKGKQARTQKIDLSKFEEVARKHDPIFVEEKVIQIFKLICILIWGGEKGLRAARRILFEVSWRVLGEKTYRAEGFLGKYFYKES